jgi:endogenous inhibitor of DNA gyrase (YacG/DUF329 family)
LWECCGWCFGHELHKHCEFWALLTHFSHGHWSETPYLRWPLGHWHKSCHRGVYWGPRHLGLDTGMEYLRRPHGKCPDGGDIVCPLKFADGRVGRWIEAYRDPMDGFLEAASPLMSSVGGRFCTTRCRAGDLAPQEWVSHQILSGAYTIPPQVGLARLNKMEKTACPHCGRALIRSTKMNLSGCCHSVMLTDRYRWRRNQTCGHGDGMRSHIRLQLSLYRLVPGFLFMCNTGTVYPHPVQMSNIMNIQKQRLQCGTQTSAAKMFPQHDKSKIVIKSQLDTSQKIIVQWGLRTHF